MNVRSYLMPLILIAGALPAAAAISRDELKKALQEEPNLVLDVLRQNKKAFFDVVTEAAKEEQTRRQQEQEQAQTKEIDDRIKDPLKPEINDKSLVRGNRKAKLTLVEYSDFQCPYCSRGYETVEALRKKYGDKLRVVFKNKPLPFHPQAMPAAQWFVAAYRQSPEKAWAFHDQLFQNQAKLGEPFYKETAKTLGLDLAKLEKDVQSQAVKDAIEADSKEASALGFEGTPGFLINGIPVRGAYPIEHFDMIIQKLEAAKP